MSKRQRLLVLFLGVAGGILAVGATAYACAVLTTLQLDSNTAAVGSTVTGTGHSFRSGDESVVSDVVITLDTRDGRELWRGRANEDRTVDVSFTLPSDVAPGRHILIASQFFADGRPVAGSPARATLQVTPAGASSSSVKQSEATAAGSEQQAATTQTQDSGEAAASGPAAGQDSPVLTASTAEGGTAATPPDAAAASGALTATSGAADDDATTSPATATAAEQPAVVSPPRVEMNPAALTALRAVPPPVDEAPHRAGAVPATDVRPARPDAPALLARTEADWTPLGVLALGAFALAALERRRRALSHPLAVRVT